MTSRNSFVSRRDANKPGPSGMSRNDAFSQPERWGGKNCLLPVDVSIVQEIKEAMGGDSILEFVTPEFSERAQAAYDSLGVMDLNTENVWHVFRDLLPLVFP